MKKIINFLLAISTIIVSFNCSRELEYGSNFEFKVNNLDNTNVIVVNNSKAFQLELFALINPTKNMNYQVAFKSNSVDIINNSSTLVQDQFYNLLFVNNKYNLSLVPKQTGTKDLEITIKDYNGVIKKTRIQFNVISDLNFKFEAVNPQPLYQNVLTTTFNFQGLLTNLASPDNYQIKAISTLGGEIKINSNTITSNSYIPINIGNINFSFKPDFLGTQKITFTVKNGNNVEQQIEFNLNVQENKFIITPLLTFFNTKLTLKKNLSFSLSNIIPTWTYKVKFLSSNDAKIYDNLNNFIPNGKDTNLTINTDSPTFVFKYEPTNIGSDILKIEVQDQYNQIQTYNLNITVYDRPKINLVDSKIQVINVINGPIRINGYYKIIGPQAFGVGATVTDYEFKVLNYSTGTWDVYTTIDEYNLYPDDCKHSSYFLKNQGMCNGSIIVGGHTQITNEDRNINYYWNQPFEARIKDSDGVWSLPVTGTVTY